METAVDRLETSVSTKSVGGFTYVKDRGILLLPRPIVLEHPASISTVDLALVGVSYLASTRVSSLSTLSAACGVLASRTK